MCDILVFEGRQICSDNVVCLMGWDGMEWMSSTNEKYDSNFERVTQAECACNFDRQTDRHYLSLLVQFQRKWFSIDADNNNSMRPTKPYKTKYCKRPRQWIWMLRLQYVQRRTHLSAHLFWFNGSSHYYYYDFVSVYCLNLIEYMIFHFHQDYLLQYNYKWFRFRNRRTQREKQKDSNEMNFSVIVGC